MKKMIVAILLLLGAMLPSAAQIVSLTDDPIDTDSLRREFDKGPYFTPYKDNYFIFGTSIGPKPTRQNTNVKFQVSVAMKLTKTTLPWHTYLYMFYSQKVVWNVLEESLPMRDLNFNPGIGLAKPLFVKNRYIGKISLMLEHESNGRDGDASRSWNKVSFAANILVDPNFYVHGKIWIPIIDGQNNRDILDYCGIYQVGASYQKSRWGGTVLLTKRKGWNFNYNTTIELSYRFSRSLNWSLFAQYYNGYGESLLDYNQFRSQLRLGIVFKPTFLSDF